MIQWSRRRTATASRLCTLGQPSLRKAQGAKSTFATASSRTVKRSDYEPDRTVFSRTSLLMIIEFLLWFWHDVNLFLFPIFTRFQFCRLSWSTLSTSKVHVWNSLLYFRFSYCEISRQIDVIDLIAHYWWPSNLFFQSQWRIQWICWLWATLHKIDIFMFGFSDRYSAFSQEDWLKSI